MNGHERRQGRRLASLLASAIVAACAFATTAWAATVELATTDGTPGGTVKLTMTLTGAEGDPAFAGAQVDLIIARAQLGIDAQCGQSAAPCDSGLDCEDSDACVLLSCDKDPRLPAAVQIVANSPRFQNVPVGATSKRIRIGVTGPVIPVTTWEDGIVLTCDLNVAESAPFGLQVLSADRVVVSDETGSVIPSQVVIVPGSIVDPSLFTPTPVTTDTPTLTATAGESTPTLTPTSTPPVGPETATPANTPSRTSTATPNGGGGTPTRTSTVVQPTATNTSTGGNGTPTPTHTQGNGGGGGGGDGCDCAISPEADRSRGTALMWLSLLPVGLLWIRRRQNF